MDKARMICDRAPCAPLLSLLGDSIEGTQEGNGDWAFILKARGIDGGEVTHKILYCPFCGIRLEEVGSFIAAKFMAQRQRRRAITTKKLDHR